MKNLSILLLFIFFYFCFKETNMQYSDDLSDSTSYYDSESYSEDYSDFTEYFTYSTIPNNSTDYEPKTPTPRIILIGFERYQIIQKEISFNVFFKRIYGYIFPKILKITLRIISGQLRNLLEEVQTINCTRFTNETEDNIIFNCSHETDLDNIIKVSVDKNYSLFDENGNTYDNLQTYITGYANRTMGNIQNEKEGIKDFIVLQNSTFFLNIPQFYVYGNISEDIGDNSVILNINENENGDIKEIPCFLTKTENQLEYKLECSPKQTISFNLDNVDGKMSNKILIISIADGENDYISIPFPNNDYGKKISSSGLKPGAIVGIVIACVFVAILATIIATLLCSKTVTDPLKNVNQVDIYSHVSNSSQQNI